MKSTFRITIIFFTFFSTHFFAQVQPQKPGVPNDLDNKYSPGKSSVFKSAAVSSSSGGGSSDEGIPFRNAVKCNFGMFPRRIAAFGYERFLSDQVGVEGWLGFVFGKDPIFSLMGTELSFSDSPGNSSIDISSIYQNGTHYQGGLFYGAAIRFNFDNYYWTSASSYISFGLRGYSEKIDISALVNQNYTSYSNSFEGSRIVDVRQLNYLLTYGYRFVTEGKVKTSHELYTAFGWRNLTHTAFETINDNNGNSITRSTTAAKATFSGMLVGIGYIFGIGF